MPRSRCGRRRHAVDARDVFFLVPGEPARRLRTPSSPPRNRRPAAALPVRELASSAACFDGAAYERQNRPREGVDVRSSYQRSSSRVSPGARSAGARCPRRWRAPVEQRLWRAARLRTRRRSGGSAHCCARAKGCGKARARSRRSVGEIVLTLRHLDEHDRAGGTGPRRSGLPDRGTRTTVIGASGGQITPKKRAASSSVWQGAHVRPSPERGGLPPGAAKTESRSARAISRRRSGRARRRRSRGKAWLARQKYSRHRLAGLEADDRRGGGRRGGGAGGDEQRDDDGSEARINP